MKQYPIRFTDEMARAYFAGRKTQHRVPINTVLPFAGPPMLDWLHPNTEPTKQSYGFWFNNDRAPCRSPFGGPGDRLWVRECWRWYGRDRGEGAEGGLQYRSDLESRIFTELPDADERHADFQAAWAADKANKWRPSVQMPRWASRITLEVKHVVVVRLQALNSPDAKAEGVEPHAYSWPEGTPPDNARDCGDAYRNGFRNLWESIYAAKGYGWENNPWVWACEFAASGSSTGGEVNHDTV